VAAVGDPRSRKVVSRETRQTVLSIALSALVAFGVASYTVQRSDDAQRREAERSRLAAIYNPVATTAAAFVSCAGPDKCTESQLLRASRDYNAASVLVVGQGSDAIQDANVEASEAFGEAARYRLKNPGARLPEPIGKRVSDRYLSLQNQITKELRP